MRRDFRFRRLRAQRGAALLLVLWSTVVIAGLAVLVAGTARSDVELARRHVAEAQARHIAQGAVTLTGLHLLAGREAEDPVLAGSTTVRLGGREIVVSLRDECGKVDLNTAWGDLLRGLMEEHAARSGIVASAAAVLDWRDPDTVPGPGGAETADYRAAGRRHGARNGPFDSVSELQQVMGMTSRFFEAVRADVTVDCLNAGIDPLVASETVLASIPGAGGEAVERFLAERRDYVEGGARRTQPQLAGSGRYVDSSPGLAIEVSATVSGTDGATVTWRAVTWLTGDGPQPILFRTWERAGR